jgi:putative membrane protein
MLKFLIRLALSALALILIAKLVPGIEIGWVSAIVAALVMGIINALVRPLLVILTLPITIITLGLFLLIVNAAMFGLAALLVPGFQVHSFGAAVIGSLLYWLANWAIHAVLKEHKQVKSLAKAK